MKILNVFKKKEVKKEISTEAIVLCHAEQIVRTLEKEGYNLSAVTDLKHLDIYVYTHEDKKAEIVVKNILTKIEFRKFYEG
jgi:hypothetical protein